MVINTKVRALSLFVQKKELLNSFRSKFFESPCVSDNEILFAIIDDLLVTINCLEHPELTELSEEELDKECQD